MRKAGPTGRPLCFLVSGDSQIAGRSRHGPAQVLSRLDPRRYSILHIGNGFLGVSPSLMQPGRSGTTTLNPPPSSANSGETITGYSRLAIAPVHFARKCGQSPDMYGFDRPFDGQNLGHCGAIDFVMRATARGGSHEIWNSRHSAITSLIVQSDSGCLRTC